MGCLLGATDIQGKLQGLPMPRGGEMNHNIIISKNKSLLGIPFGDSVSPCEVWIDTLGVVWL